MGADIFSSSILISFDSIYNLLKKFLLWIRWNSNLTTDLSKEGNVCSALKDREEQLWFLTTTVGCIKESFQSHQGTFSLQMSK